MNLGTIRDEIRRLIQDTSSDTSLQRWTNAVLLTRINIIQDEIAAITRMNEKRATDTNAEAGTAEYDLPTDFQTPIQVLFKDSNGIYVPVEKITEQELNHLDPNWRDTTDDPPDRYYIRLEKIGLYPYPSVSRASALRIDYVMRLADLTNDSDIPFNSVYKFYPYHSAICFGVARLCKMDEGKTANEMKYEYEQGIAKIMREVSAENEETRIPNIYEKCRAIPRRSR